MISAFFRRILEEEDSTLVSLRRSFFLALLCFSPFLFQMIGDLFWQNISIPPLVQLIAASILQGYVALPFYRSAFLALRKKRCNMNTLVTLGTSAAYGYSLFSYLSSSSQDLYFASSATVITLILLGRIIEISLQLEAKSSMRDLRKLQPQTVLIQEGESRIQKSIEEVKIGDIYIVMPGDIVPLDGVIVKNPSFVKESILTGESAAVEKKEGDAVFAGTLNESSVFLAKASSVGKDTVLGKIITIVEEGAAAKVKRPVLVDLFSAYFVPFVIFFSALSAVFWMVIDPSYAVRSAVSVLIVACPCAIGLASPMVLLVTSALAAKLGILIKDVSICMEKSKIDTVCFDKTGTLTKGQMQLVDLALPKDDLDAIYALSSFSKHPLAKAFCAAKKEDKKKLLPVTSFSSATGKGVKGIINGVSYQIGSKKYLEEKNILLPDGFREEKHGTNSLIYFARNGRYLGYAAFADVVKNGAKEAIESLREKNIETVILSGDRIEAVEDLQKKVRADRFLGGLSPSEKAASIEEMQKKGKKVAFVGDGVNDAPALVKADIGFAVLEASDIAMEHADIGLLYDGVSQVKIALELRDLAQKKIVQNIFFAVIYNALTIPFAALGLFSPVLGAILMTLSSSSVILNALHLKVIEKKPFAS